MSNPNKFAMTACRNVAISQAPIIPAMFLLVHQVPYVSIFLFIVAVLGYAKLSVDNALASRPSPESLEAHSRWVDEKCTPKTEYDCHNYEQTSFEIKLASEGVIKREDITLCSDKSCPLCKPELEWRKEELEKRRKAILEEERAKRHAHAVESDKMQLAALSEDDRTRVLTLEETARDWKSNKERGMSYKDRSPKMVECQSCRGLTFFTILCPTCRIKNMNMAEEQDRVRRQQEAEAAKRAEEARRAKEFQQNRWVIKDGLRFQRPTEVPEGATPNVSVNPGVTDGKADTAIIWTYFTPEGKQVKYFQPIVADYYEVNTPKGAVDSWVAVFDPVTGEHLGDYRRNERGEASEIRNPQSKASTVCPVCGDRKSPDADVCAGCAPSRGPKGPAGVVGPKGHHIHTGDGCACFQSQARLKDDLEKALVEGNHKIPMLMPDAWRATEYERKMKRLRSDHRYNRGYS